MSHLRPSIRLFVPEPFAAGGQVALAEKQSHYLAGVMRLKRGDAVAVFNGRDGEWLAEIAAVEKKRVRLALQQRLAAQTSTPDLWLVFVPVKNRSESMVEKAVELGASRIVTVIARHAVVRKINGEKLAAHAVEAAEQCGRHDVPDIASYENMPALLAAWPKDRTLLYGDESGGGEPLGALLSSLSRGKYGVLVGPEGGFAAEEHRMLKLLPSVKPFGMGPRILRADTAAIAALACVQSWLGDWEEKPHFKAAE